MQAPANISPMRAGNCLSCPAVSALMCRKYGSSRLTLTSLHLQQLAVCLFVVIFLTPPLWAQQTGAIPGWPKRSSGSDHATPDPVAPLPPSIPDRDESCLLWTVTPVPAPTISAVALQVPAKARAEFKKGCTDLKSKKLGDAENHLRKALDEYRQYAAAWVLLGQVLEAGNRVAEARTACSQASVVDPDYAQAYLCLADVAGRLREWQVALDQAERALALGPRRNAYGYLYSAMAHYYLAQLPDAEKNALDAIDADQLNRVPQAHLLLARIYTTNHDLPSAAAQLRAYLKIVPNAPNSAGVKKTLAELESQIAK
jgi:tetratricopeptide (TPR) repeat protein